METGGVALLLVDFQNYGYDPKGYWAKRSPPGMIDRGAVAIENTAREASDLGHRVIVLRDCCMAITEEEEDYFFRVVPPDIGHAMTADEFIQSLER